MKVGLLAFSCVVMAGLPAAGHASFPGGAALSNVTPTVSRNAFATALADSTADSPESATLSVFGGVLIVLASRLRRRKA